MIIAQRVAVTLGEFGIRRVYGLPGEDHMTLLDAFAEAGISYHAAVNESSAVIMAATDAQISGVPGVVVLSLAPGISNGVNGLAHAALEFSPVLVISGNHPANREPFVVRQGFDLARMVEPFMKWSARLSVKTDVVLALCKALDIASAHRPGPVFLQLPDEVAKEEESHLVDSTDAIDVLRDGWADRGQTRLIGNNPTENSLTSIHARLSEAKHPVIVVGGRRPDLMRETLELVATRYRCPVFTSSGQKGLLNSESPYYAGTFLNGSLEASILARCDTLLMINPEAYDYYNKQWTHTAYTIAITPAALDEWVYPFSQRVVADPELTFVALSQRFREARSEWTIGDVRAYREHVRVALLSRKFDGLTVPVAVNAVLASAPPNARIVVDAGFSKPIVAMLSEPSRRGDYLASNGLSTMGYSIPAALGAARAAGEPLVPQGSRCCRSWATALC